jgi:hypothetical protein
MVTPDANPSEEGGALVVAVWNGHVVFATCSDRAGEELGGGTRSASRDRLGPHDEPDESW